MPFISSNWNSKKECILYFIVQSVGSLIILSGGLFMFILLWSPFGFALKMGISPIHFWGGPVVVKLKNIHALLLLTWQKLAPLSVFIRSTTKQVLTLFIVTNALTALLCVGSKSLSLLLFFSGLLHFGWMMATPHWCKYFCFYCLVVFPLFSVKDTFNFSLLIINISGLPPMTGFIIKFEVLQMVRFDLAVFLLLMSAPVLFAYVRQFLFVQVSGDIALTTIVVCSLGLIS